VTTSHDGTRGYDVLDHVPIGIFVLDRSMRVVFWNACLEDWTGIPRDDILGQDVRDRFPLLGRRRSTRRLEDLFTGGAPAVFSSQLHPHFLRAPLRSGRLRVEHTVAVAVPGGSGEYHALVAVQDVTNLADAVAALRSARDTATQLAATDPLTGVANRRHFMEEAERIVALAVRHGRPCSLLVLDIDSFKAVNDTHGHAAGDEVLRRVIEVSRRTLRETDLLGRLGGDEFAALLPETPPELGRRTAERLRVAVAEEAVLYEDKTLWATVSIGLSGLVGGRTTVEGLLREADTALYEAKNLGRNRVALARSRGHHQAVREDP
jgi:diguanylate cyclase (GGDEF)-like protein/PAS domain S-box-containing protein